MSLRVSISAILAIACLTMPACGPAPAPAKAPAAPAKAQTAETAKPFEVAEGERVTIAPLQAEGPDPSAFGVVQLDTLAGASNLGTVRIFGTASGDPAANGLMTYLGFNSAHDGVGFLLGNFRTYRVIAAAPGRIDLEIDEDVIGDGGELKPITRRVIVSWIEKPQADSPNPEFPAALTITPAR